MEDRTVWVGLSTGVDFDMALQQLQDQNDLATKAGLSPCFLGAATDYASEITWLLQRPATVEAPLPGGGFVYLAGVNHYASDVANRRMITGMGGAGLESMETVCRTGGGAPEQYVRICVGKLEQL